MKNDLDLLRAFVMSSSLQFAKYFHYVMTGQKFLTSPHHIKIANYLDMIVTGELRKLIINVPPRSGKTLQAVKYFIPFCMAKNPQSNFMHLSYAATLAESNVSEARDVIKHPEYQRLFPHVRLSQTTDSKSDYKTTAGGTVYATGTMGSVTGMGAGSMQNPDYIQFEGEPGRYYLNNPFCGALILDDPLKPEEALSDLQREKVNQRFENTIRSRVNSLSTPIIIIMQRLHENDLTGYLLKNDNKQVAAKHLVIPAITIDQNTQEEHSIWPHRYPLDALHRMRDSDPHTFETQYMQNPTPIEGLLYDRPFRTYDTSLPPHDTFEKVWTCVDVADTGKDFLCAITTLETTQGLYVLDVIYTQKSVEYTAPILAETLTKYRTTDCLIETNNSGRLFMKDVERRTRILGNNFTRFAGFVTKENKEIKIFSRAVEVNNTIVFPSGWQSLYPQFYNEVRYRTKAGRHAHDDACDTLSEMVSRRFYKPSSQSNNYSLLKRLLI